MSMGIMPCEEGPIGFKRVLVLRKIKVRTRSAQNISRCRRLTELIFLFTSLWCQKCKIEGQKWKIEGPKWKIAGARGNPNEIITQRTKMNI